MYTCGCLYCYTNKMWVWDGVGVKKERFDVQHAIQDYSQLAIVRKVFLQVAFCSHLRPMRVMIEPETREIPQTLASGIK